MTSEQMLEVAELAENYGSGQLCLTVGQNIILPNVPDSRIASSPKSLCFGSYATIRPRSCAVW
jgi:ferredoxin-nitrite reductase